jgi:hypothetical protein
MPGVDDEGAAMKHERPEAADAAHVFDQTNGIADVRSEEPTSSHADDGWSDADRRRVVGGIAMMSVKKP